MVSFLSKGTDSDVQILYTKSQRGAELHVYLWAPEQQQERLARHTEDTFYERGYSRTQGGMQLLLLSPQCPPVGCTGLLWGPHVGLWQLRPLPLFLQWS